MRDFREFARIYIFFDKLIYEQLGELVGIGRAYFGRLLSHAQMLPQLMRERTGTMF